MRWVRRLLVGLLLLVVVITIFGFFLVRRSFPQVVGEIKAAGLEEQVEIVRDGDGIPHIYASNEHDLFSPRATSMPKIGSGRWTSGATSAPGGSPRCSAAARWTRICS